MNDTIPPDASEHLVRLIAQAQRRLFAFVLALVRRTTDAEDILQETNVVLWRKRETFRPESDFFAWAFEIARLQVLSHRTRQSRHGDPFDVTLLDEIADAARVESHQFDQRGAALSHCLEKLTVQQRKLIVRRYQPDVAVQSLAEELGKSANAVSEMLRRIRETLRQCIERTLSAESRS